jgi:PhzF family phenazine biosynthesis protein
MRSRAFAQVDVFGAQPGGGNPVAVVLDGEGLADDAMQRFARWTNLSETTFVLPPSGPPADYRVRIFTPALELPFAGHPTLGTCHAWLQDTGRPGAERVVQECGAGLVEIRRTERGLAFAAPPLVREGPVEPALRTALAEAMGIGDAAIVEARWVDNGPGWVALLLDSAERVLGVRPSFVDAAVGLAGPHPPGGEAAIEVRAFFPKDGALAEDPVTGSLNASLGQWLLGSGRLSSPYVAAQGTALGRAGRVHVSRDGGRVWVAGATTTLVAGTVALPTS